MSRLIQAASVGVKLFPMSDFTKDPQVGVGWYGVPPISATAENMNSLLQLAIILQRQRLECE